MTRAAGVFVSAASILLAVPHIVRAQDAPAGRVEVGGGIVWFGESALGSRDATLTTSSGAPSRLFATSTTVTGAPGVEGRIAVRVSRRLEGEAIVSYRKPSLESALSNDAENAASTTATETIQEWVIGGGALVYVPLAESPRFRPFVSGSIAYLRQLHDPTTLAVTGRTYQVGGGAKYFFTSRPTGRMNGFGVRVDARLAIRTGGVAFDDAAHYAPALAASLFVRF